MQIDAADLAPRDAYHLLISCVIPRPIAWVSTLGPAGGANLAPFSFFGGVTSSPPTVMVSVGRRRGERKDTARNLLATGEAVVHIAHRPLAGEMVATSAELPYGEDEFHASGLAKAASVDVSPPRIADAAIAMEARVVHHHEVGDGPVDLFLLEIVRFHLAEEFLSNGLPDAATLAAVGRLGGRRYCDTAGVFEIPRPE